MNVDNFVRKKSQTLTVIFKNLFSLGIDDLQKREFNDPSLLQHKVEKRNLETSGETKGRSTFILFIKPGSQQTNICVSLTITGGGKKNKARADDK